MDLNQGMNQPASHSSFEPAPEPVRVCIDTSQPRLPHLRCVEGQHVLKEVALNPAGFQALIELDLMRKPRSLKLGAMHNWVELDGELFRFDDGSQGAAALEKTLNERYVSEVPGAVVHNVEVFPNPASPTGFDLQFPAKPHGFAENRRRHLNDETVEILNDPEKCRVLRTGMVVVLEPPQLVFKRRLADLSESHLEPSPNNTVKTRGPDGQEKSIDLSQPVDLTGLSASQLVAVLNHPSINRRAGLAMAASDQAGADGEPQRQAA